MSGAIPLPARLDTGAADALDRALAGKGDLRLDASAVEMLGGLCLERLCAAIRARRAKGHSVTIVALSEAAMEDLATLGFTPESLAEGLF